MSGAGIPASLGLVAAAGAAAPSRLTPAQGIALFAACQACLVVDGIAVHQLGPAVGLDQLTLLRGLGSCVLVAALMVRAGSAGGAMAMLRTRQPGLQITRGALTLVSLWLIFHGLANLPLADASALNYTRPIWMTVFGALLLHEAVSRQRWVATGIGFAGALLVIGPVFGDWQIAYLTALAGAAVNAAAVVATRQLGRRDAPATTLAWLTGVTLIGSVTAIGKPLPLEQWPALLMVAAVGTLAVWCGLVAVRAAEVSLLAPYEFLRLPIVMLLGLALFAEVPGTVTLLGSALILLSGLLPLLRPWRRVGT